MTKDEIIGHAGNFVPGLELPTFFDDVEAAGLCLLAGRVLGHAIHESRFESLDRHKGEETLETPGLEPGGDVCQVKSNALKLLLISSNVYGYESNGLLPLH